jgi:hypothetical protein
MCLSRLIPVNRQQFIKIEKKYDSYIGWKWFRIKGNQNQLTALYMKTKNYIEKQWLFEEDFRPKEKISIQFTYGGGSYPSGFHVFLDNMQSRYWIDMMDPGGNPKVLKKVYYKDIRVIGEDMFNIPTVVVGKIFIIGEK